MNNNYSLLILGLIIVFLISISIIFKSQQKIEENRKFIEDSYIPIITAKTIDFEADVYDYILQIKIQHPQIVFIQARIESGNFSSDLFLDYNNMFGMKMPNKRPTTAIGKTKSGYAIYDSWENSIIDYALYQAYTAKNLSEEEYIRHLNNYAKDSLYTVKIREYAAQLRSGL